MQESEIDKQIIQYEESADKLKVLTFMFNVGYFLGILSGVLITASATLIIFVLL